MAAVRSVLEEIWRSVRLPMTAGQRQSAVLLVPLTVILVLYGRPAVTSVGPVLETPAFPAPTDAMSAPELADPGPPPAPSESLPGPTGAASGSADAPTSPVPEAVELGTGESPTPPPGAGVVALVRPDAGGSPVSDTDMAAAFVSQLESRVTTVTMHPDTDACSAVLADGSMVLASSGLGPALRACLVEGGATVVAYDALGSLPPGTAGPGQVLSTRRGFVDGLVDLARWAVAAGESAGPVGIVTVDSARGETERALPLLEAAGLDVAAIAYLPDDNHTVAVPRSVLEFLRSGVSSTVFAAPVAVQRDWVRQASIVSPDMAYLVADAFDAVIDAGYPAAFEGTPALTTLRFPWSLEPVPARDECDRRWEEASGGTELPARARLQMYAWCQHVALADRAPDGRLRDTMLESPITTDLGPLVGGYWGPTEHVVVRWRGACDCWVRDGPVIDRTTDERNRP